jgi:RNA polymerase sigma-70 factor (ECF subfamily)
MSQLAGSTLPSAEPGSTGGSAADRRLMSAFARGEAGAAEVLYERFAPLIFGIGLRTFHDRDLAAELVEKTFVRLLRRAPRFTSGSAPLDTWVLYQAVGVTLQMSQSARAGPEDARSDAVWLADPEPVRA